MRLVEAVQWLGINISSAKVQLSKIMNVDKTRLDLSQDADLRVVRKLQDVFPDHIRRVVISCTSDDRFNMMMVGNWTGKQMGTATRMLGQAYDRYNRAIIMDKPDVNFRTGLSPEQLQEAKDRDTKRVFENEIKIGIRNADGTINEKKMAAHVLDTAEGVAAVHEILIDSGGVSENEPTSPVPDALAPVRGATDAKPVTQNGNILIERNIDNSAPVQPRTPGEKTEDQYDSVGHETTAPNGGRGTGITIVT